MVDGLVLIALGLGLFWTAPTYSDVAGEVNREQARRARETGAPRVLQRLFEFNVRHGPGAPRAALFGRLIGVAVVLVGVGLVVADLL